METAVIENYNPSLAERLGIETASQLPWWVVSISFHGLAILLLTLISFAAKPILEEDVLITTSRIIKPTCKIDVDKPENKDTGNKKYDILTTNKSDFPETDPLTTENNTPMFIPPELLKDFELGDHIETNNPDRPDTGGAYGVPEAKSLHDLYGIVDNPGGGGTEGADWDESIGIGSGTKGTGGGFGGGNGTGIGPGEGSGRGTWGDRDKAGRKNMTTRWRSQETISVVDIGLEWLAKHQEIDGHWDAQKYQSEQKTDTAITAFATLAFLAAGHTEKVGTYKDVVRKGIAWLISKQNAEGLIFDSTDAGGHRGVGYPHAIATMALAEATGMTSKRIPSTAQSAQKAVDYATKIHQSGEGYEKGGFRYQPKQAGDLSVTGWYIMMLKSAKVAGLQVDTASFQGAIKFLDSVERKGKGGDAGYGLASIYAYEPNNDHEFTSHRLTAIGALCRQFLGWKPAETEATVQWFVKKGGIPNGWGEGKTDLYYWYYGTLCTFQQGGDTWKQWNEGMKKTLLDNQRRDAGGEFGSWDPVGDYSKEWGRVGQTALACLCLEVYYRYLPMCK